MTPARQLTGAYMCQGQDSSHRGPQSSLSPTRWHAFLHRSRGKRVAGAPARPMTFRPTRSLALEVLEHHLTTAPHPVPAVMWRQFSTHFTTSPTGTRRA